MKFKDLNGLTNYLKLTRVARGLSQPQLAERAGLAKTNISHIEAGRRFNFKNIRSMADALGFDLKFVLTKQSDITGRNVSSIVGDCVEGHYEKLGASVGLSFEVRAVRSAPPTQAQSQSVIQRLMESADHRAMANFDNVVKAFAQLGYKIEVEAIKK